MPDPVNKGFDNLPEERACADDPSNTPQPTDFSSRFPEQAF